MENSDDSVEVSKILRSTTDMEVLQLTGHSCSALTTKTIRRQFKNIALRIHPDKNKHPLAEKAFHRLSSAMEMMIRQLDENKVKVTEPVRSKEKKEAPKANEQKPAKFNEANQPKKRKVDLNKIRLEEEMKFNLEKAMQAFRQNRKRKSEKELTKRDRNSEIFDSEFCEELLEDIESRSQRWRNFTSNSESDPSPLPQLNEHKGECFTNKVSPHCEDLNEKTDERIQSAQCASIETSRIICVICKRKFDSEAKLVRHEQFSSLHRENLMKIPEHDRK